jgi:hypothetical protein
VRQTIGVDFDHGLTDANWISNALEPPPDRQVGDLGKLRHFYFCTHYSLISLPLARSCGFTSKCTTPLGAEYNRPATLGYLPGPLKSPQPEYVEGDPQRFNEMAAALLVMRRPGYREELA